MAVLLAVLAVVLLVSRFRGASALEKWQSEMRRRGEKLTIAELAPPRGSTNDTTLSELQLATGRLEARAIRPAEFAALILTAPGLADPSWALAELRHDSGTAKSTDWSKVRPEMEAARNDLDRIGQVLLHPAPTSDFDYQDNTIVPNYIAERVAAQWLSGATLYELHEGRLFEAQTRLGASINLIGLHKDDLTLVKQMIRVAIANLMLETTWAALQAPGWNETALRGLQQNWEDLQFLEKFAPTMTMERARMATAFAVARTNGLQTVRARMFWGASPPRSWETRLKEHVLDQAWRLAWSGADELYFWQSTQPGLAAVRLAVQHKSFSRLRIEMAGGANQSTAAVTGYDAIRYQLSLVLRPNFLRAHEYMMRAETMRNLAIAAIAIQRHQLRHGAPLPNLAALVPEFLIAVPVDYMDGAPMRYHCEANGGYRLYSVGLDGRDDDGDSQSSAPWRQYSGMWDGRDAVWPERSPVRSEPAASPEVIPLVQFEQAPLVDVLKALARQAGWNVAFDPGINWTVASRVTIRLENVTAEDVIAAVLNNNNLSMVKQPGTNLVGVTSAR